MSNMTSEQIFYINALLAYSKIYNGQMLSIPFQENVNVTLPWTQNTWEDGTPITRYFSECKEPIVIKFKKGDEFEALHYRSILTNCNILSFKKNDIWFYAEKYDADRLLEALGFGIDEL